MTTDQLEQRLAAVEKALADVQQRLVVLANGAARTRTPPPRPMTPEEEEVEKYYQAVCQYVRKTGQDPPPDWKPGDPIPDPEWWS
jgi:hypothetical protein